MDQTPTSPHPEPPHPLARARSGIVILAALVIFAPLAIDLYLPALPTITAELQTTSAMVQRTLTAFLGGFCLGMLVYGPLSDVIGRRPVALIGTTVFVLSSLACAFATSVETLTILRFLQAFGGGATAVMGRTIVRDVFPKDKTAQALSMVALVTAITPMLAPLVGGQVLALTGWRSIFLLLAAYGVFVLLLILLAIPESLPRHHRKVERISQALGAYGPIFLSRRAWACALASGGIYGAMFAYIAGTPFVYIEMYGVSPQAYGFLFALNIVSQMVGTTLNTRLVGRVGLLPMVRWATTVAGLSAVCLAICTFTGWGGLPAIVLCLMPIVGVTALVSSNMTARIMGLFPHAAGAAAAAITALSFGLGAISSFAIGLLSDGTPHALGLVILAFCTTSFIASLPLFTGDETT